MVDDVHRFKLHVEIQAARGEQKKGRFTYRPFTLLNFLLVLRIYGGLVKVWLSPTPTENGKSIDKVGWVCYNGGVRLELPDFSFELLSFPVCRVPVSLDK